MTEAEERSEEASARRIAEIEDRMRGWAQEQNAVRRAGEVDLRPTMDPQDLRARQGALPRWWSGVEGLDMNHDGFQGVSLIGGEYGTGKSMLALGSALQAAHDGACVCYFDAENPGVSVRERIARWYGSMPNFEARYPQISGRNFFWIPVYSGHELKQIARTVLSLRTSMHDGALIAFDSLNACASLLYKGEEQTAGSMVSRLCRWMDQVVRTTEGRVRCLALTELNAAGEIKWLEPMYVATVALAIQHAPEQGEDAVTITLKKNRNGAGRRSLGVYTRRWKTTRFERLQ